MPTFQPRVSVGLPVYNGERFLAEAIESILRQTYSDWELIISDNGSQDGTQDICRNYARREPRVRYVRYEENRGAAWNYNTIVKLASGDYFKWAAHDDLIYPSFLKSLVRVLDADRTVVLAHSRVAFIDEAGDIRGLQDEPAAAESPRAADRFLELVYGWDCEAVFGLIRRDILTRTRLIGAYSHSDYTLLMELSLYGRFSRCPEVLFARRLHADISDRKYPDREERAEWFDPALKGRRSCPWWRQLRELGAAVARTPLAPQDRFLCGLHLCRWVYYRRRGLGRELGRAFGCARRSDTTTSLSADRAADHGINSAPPRGAPRYCGQAE